MSENSIGREQFEITKVPLAFADAFSEFVNELTTEERNKTRDEDTPSLNEVRDDLYKSNPGGLWFASTSFETSMFLLRIRKPDVELTENEIWDMSISRYTTAAFLRRQKNNIS